MSEQKLRIPDIDLDQFGPQDVQVVDEGFISLEPAVEPSAVKWVKDYKSLERLKELDAPEIIIKNSEKLLSEDRLLSEASRILTNGRAARAFDKLITTYALSTGQLEELVETTKPRFASPERRLHAAILDDVTYRPGDIYQFSKVFKDVKAPHTTRRRLAVLHTEALAAAEAKLAEQLPEFSENFKARLQAAVDKGILPKSALPDPETDLARAKRLQEVSVVASDPTLNSFYDIGGHFEGENNVIQLDAAEVLDGGDDIEHYYTHEELHDHSGITVRLERFRDLDERFNRVPKRNVSNEYEMGTEETVINLYAPRVGLNSSGNAFNEAYTEWATMQLFDEEYDQQELWKRFLKADFEEELYPDFSDIYLGYRIMQAGLVSHGIDMLTIGEAYFESYEPKMNNPQREPGKSAPARRKLDAAIAEHTPFKSLNQMEIVIFKELKDRYPQAAPREQQWNMAQILAEKLGDLPAAA